MKKKYLLLALVITLTFSNIYSQSNLDELKSLSNIELIKVGNQLPEINLPSAKNQLINLNAYRGKYIFINIWATWCSPCLKNIPFYEELIEKHKKENIEFVMISVDDSKEEWQNYVLNNDYKGIHLFANGKQTKPISYFIYRIYEENGNITKIEHKIPRYILVDPNGIILSNSLDTMSREEITKCLDEILK